MTNELTDAEREEAERQYIELQEIYQRRLEKLDPPRRHNQGRGNQMKVTTVVSRGRVLRGISYVLGRLAQGILWVGYRIGYEEIAHR